MTASPVMLRAPELRTYATALEVRELETNRALSELRGRAVPYGVETNVGWYLESFRRGAFSKSIKESAAQLPLLLWHDERTFPVGVASSWSDTEQGLDGVWRLDDSELAQRAARQARDGFLTGLSVGFQPLPNGSKWSLVDDDDWDPQTGNVDSVERVAARLLEVSLTPTPAYAGAQVALVRSQDVPAHARARWNRPQRHAELDRWRQVLDELRLPQRGA